MFVYSASFEAQAVSTATDLFEFTTLPADRSITMLALTACQTTDLGDAAEEVLRIGLYRGATAGSTGTASTEVAYVDSQAPAAGSALNHLRGTASTGGTLLEVIGWNIRIPLLWCPIPELRPTFDAAEDPVTFRLITAPADAVTMSATVFWQEN